MKKMKKYFQNKCNEFCRPEILRLLSIFLRVKDHSNVNQTLIFSSFSSASHNTCFDEFTCEENLFLSNPKQNLLLQLLIKILISGCEGEKDCKKLEYKT